MSTLSIIKSADFDWKLVAAALLLSLFGVFLIFSAQYHSNEPGAQSYYVKQLIWLGIAIIAFKKAFVEIQAKHACERAMLAEHARAVRLTHVRLDFAHHRVAGFDIDAGIGIGQLPLRTGFRLGFRRHVR